MPYLYHSRGDLAPTCNDLYKKLIRKLLRTPRANTNGYHELHSLKLKHLNLEELTTASRRTLIVGVRSCAISGIAQADGVVLGAGRVGLLLTLVARTASLQ